MPQEFRGLLLAHGLRHVGGDQQGRDFSRHGEGRIAAIFFPAVLLRDGPIDGNERRSLANHRPPAGVVAEAARRFAAQEIDKQDGKGGFIHLQAVPVRAAIEPHVLRPMTISFLRGFEVMKNAQSVVRRSSGQQAASILDQVAWPDKVVAA